MLLEFFFILDFVFNIFWSNWFILGGKNFDVCSFWREKIDVILGIIGDLLLEKLFYLDFLVMFLKFWFLLVYRFCLSMFCFFFKIYCFLILVCVFKVLFLVFKRLIDVNRLFGFEFFFFISDKIDLFIGCWISVLFDEDFLWGFLNIVVFESLRRLLELFIFE